MKPTHYQSAVLTRIEKGDRRVDGPQDTRESLIVHSFQWSRDGESIVAHRTVLRDDATGDPRLDFRTELFRIPRDGVVVKL